MTREVEALMQQGKWNEALTECQKLIEQQPVNPRAHGYLGMCFMRLNKFAEAEPAFRKAITLDPNFWEAGVRLAQCLDRQLKDKEGLQIAEHYLKMRPHDHALQTLVNGLWRQQ